MIKIIIYIIYKFLIKNNFVYKKKKKKKKQKKNIK